MDISPDVKKFTVVGIEMNCGSTISAIYKNTIGPREIPNPDIYKLIPKRIKNDARSPFYILSPHVAITNEVIIMMVPICKRIFRPAKFNNVKEIKQAISKIRRGKNKRTAYFSG